MKKISLQLLISLFIFSCQEAIASENPNLEAPFPTQEELKFLQLYRQINALSITDRATLLFTEQHNHLIDARQREAYRYTNPPKEGECPFCEQVKANDDGKYKILKRLKHSFVMMNANPYTKGSLIFMPYEHVVDDSKQSPHALLEMAFLEIKSRAIMQKLLAVESVNCGYGVGPDAGISVKGHFHKQLVARPKVMGYGFLEMTGNAVVASYNPDNVYNIYKPEFDELKIPNFGIVIREEKTVEDLEIALCKDNC